MAPSENIRPTKQFLVTVPDCEPGISANNVEMSLVDLDSYYVAEILPFRESIELRDQFAMAAMPEIGRQFSVSTQVMVEEIGAARKYSGPLVGLIAICAYEQADAMMEARKVTPSGDPK